MDNKIYSITLADGTKIENLRRNGDNYISDVFVDAALFEYNCSPVVFSDGEVETVHEHMELIQVAQQPNGQHWIAMRDISEKELAQSKMQSDIEYIAMMAGVEL